MKIKKYRICFYTVLALLAGIMSAPALRAQDAASSVESRYLFVFDTSSAMKKRLSAEERAINEIFAISLNGQLQPGDSIGAWTFGRELQTGEFPLETWQRGDVTAVSSTMTAFVKSRHYSRSTSFDQLMQVLNQVVRSSPRLTVFIFCDGEGQINGTPWDANINSIFKEHGRSMKKARQPFLIILRSQFGRYVGSSINTPDSITIPPLPPVYQPPPPVPAPKPSPPPPPPPPLVIIGTHVGTNVPPATPPPVTPQPHIPVPAPVTPPPPARPVPPAISPPPANPTSENKAPENNVMQQAMVSTPPTNAVAATPETASPPAVPAPVVTPLPAPSAPAVTGKSHWLAIGAVVVILVGVLGYLILRPRHRASPSLITESLKKK